PSSSTTRARRSKRPTRAPARRRRRRRWPAPPPASPSRRASTGPAAQGRIPHITPSIRTQSKRNKARLMITVMIRAFGRFAALSHISECRNEQRATLGAGVHAELSLRTSARRFQVPLPPNGGGAQGGREGRSKGRRKAE